MEGCGHAVIQDQCACNLPTREKNILSDKVDSTICDDEPMLMIQIFTWEKPAVKLD